MKRKKNKLKIKTKGKEYSLQDSPFYKLSSKKKLAALLQSSTKILAKLASDKNYNVFDKIDEPGGKPREIQAPVNIREVVHTRIASLLSRIQIPVNIHSGIKGRSYLTNARGHASSSKVLTTDVQKFFPSTSHEMIFRLFHHRFKMPGDVANLLAKICTYKKHLPTGSRLSMPLAYWANSKMFEELHALSSKHGVNFSIYVDDLTFSGREVNNLFLQTVSKIVQKHGHNLHPIKTKLYSKNNVKIITGVAVTGNQMILRNLQHKKIFDDIESWKKEKDVDVLEALERSLRGRLNAASQISLRYKDKARTIQRLF